MSTMELLEQVKALAPKERRMLWAAVWQTEQAPPERRAARGKKVKWPDVVARTRRIFGQKARPNLVLMERDEAAR